MVQGKIKHELGIFNHWYIFEHLYIYYNKDRKEMRSTQARHKYNLSLLYQTHHLILT